MWNFLLCRMREVDVGEGKALLVREGSEFHALGAKCTHYGAPLVKGVHCNGRVRCPWHGACFDVKTGDIEDFPGLDSIPKYEVNVLWIALIFMGTDFRGLSKNYTFVGFKIRGLSIFLHYYAPGLKGPPGASSNWIVCPSVRLSVCLSVCP